MDKDDDMETQRTKIKITDLNPHLTCILCGGYFIDATTIIECLHPFCRACIVRYLESSKFCPICEVMVHKTRPLQNIRHLNRGISTILRSDETLQDLVYKLVPGLYRNEMKRRRDFYANNNNRVRNASNKNQLPTTTTSGEDRGDEALQRLIYTGDESISLSLELCTGRTEERLKFLTKENLNGNNKNKNKEVRYLLCPAAFTVAHIKKFLRMKFELGPNYEIQIFHSEEPLKETYTLIDIAYIYTWRRNAPLRLSYSVFENDNKKPRLTMPESVRESNHLKDPHRSIQIPVSVTNTNTNNSLITSTMTEKATSKINTNSTAIVPKVSTSGTTTSNSNGLHPSQHPPAVSQTSCNPTLVTSSSCTVSSSCTTPMEVTPSSSNNSSHNNHNQMPKGKPPVNDSAVFHKPALPPQKHSQGLKTLQASKPLQPIAPKPQSDLNRRPPTFIAPKSPSHSVQLTASKVSMAGIPKHPTMHHQQQQQQQQQQQHLHHHQQHQHHHHQQHQHQHHQQQNLMQKSLNNEKFTTNNFQPPSPSPSPSPVVIPKPGINSANAQRIIQPGTLKIPQNYGQKNAQTNWQKMSAAGLHKPVHTNGSQKSLPMSPAMSGNKLQPGCSNNCTGGNIRAGSRSEVCLVPKSESKKLADAIMNGNKTGNSSKSEFFGAATMPAPKSAKKDGTNDGNKDKLMKINGNASKTEIAGVS